MTSQALYNRWRSQSFDDILGQEHITGTLRNQLRAGRIGHAYLFTGVRGTGKTSMARILAKAVNCVGETDDPPCNACHMCRSITAGRSLDLIEIDGASNRGIDEIRELRERVGFVPQEGRFKIYVIDEVHMLTREAFNGLLKTLEEPPQHVIFVLCTTEAYRLPETILSRCQRFDFRRATVEVVAHKLARICASEGIEATPEALEYIARRGAGSFRDAESLLDQVAAYSGERMDLAFVQRVLGAASAEAVTQLIAAMMHGDAAQGLSLINATMDQGADPRQFLGEILDQLRAMLLLRVGSQEPLNTLAPGTVAALDALLHEQSFAMPLLIKAIRAFQAAGQELRNAVRLQLPLELALVEVVVERGTPPAARIEPAQSATPTAAGRERAPIRATVAEPQSVPPAPEEESGPPGAEVAPVAQPALLESEPEAAGREPTPQLTLDWVRGKWRQVTGKVFAQDPKMRGVLAEARPIRVRGETVILACESEFHRERLAEARRSALVEQVMAKVLGVPCRIECVVGAPQDAGSSQPGGGSGAGEHLFSRTERRERLEQELRSHPAVKALEQRGGQVTRVELNDDEE